MTNAEIALRLRKVVKQFYEQSPQKYIENAQLHFIGGVTQTALFLLPNKEYEHFKQYIYDKYGYDPGGVTTGQVSMEEYLHNIQL